MSEDIKNVVESLEENEFILPVGYEDKEGIIHKKVRLTPMTGETEEAISDPKIRDNGGKVISALLESVIESIGTIPRITKDVVKDLTVVDRDFLLLKSRLVSMGESVEYVDNCPHCKAKNDINVNISNIETKYLENDTDREKTFMLPIGYRDSNGVAHKEITIRIPTGRVQESVAQVVRVNPAQATTAMLQLITVRLGTLDFINPDVFKKMTKKDRDYISNQLSSMEVGVKFDSEVICSSCGASFTTSIPLMSLLGE